MKKKISVLLSTMLIVALTVMTGCSSGTSQAPAEPAPAPAPAEAPAAPAETPAAAEAPAAGGDNLSLSKEITVGFSVADFAIPFPVTISEAAKTEAKRLGNIKLDVVDAAGDVNKQIASIENFVTAKVDAIIILAVNTDTLGGAVQKAVDAGIPVFGVNRRLGDGIPVVTFVGCDDVEAGYKLAEMTTELLGGLDKPGNVAYILGGLGSSSQVERSEGTANYIKEKNPAWKLVAEQTDGWDGSVAIDVTQNFLQKFPAGQLNAIISQDPFGATSAAMVVKDVNRPELSGKVLGTDMPKEVYSMIESGEIYGTVLQDPAEQGMLVVQAVVKHLNGEKLPEWTKTELPLVTQSNYKDFSPTW